MEKIFQFNYLLLYPNQQVADYEIRIKEMQTVLAKKEEELKERRQENEQSQDIADGDPSCRQKVSKPAQGPTFWQNYSFLKKMSIIISKRRISDD